MMDKKLASKMQGVSAHSMIVDEIADYNPEDVQITQQANEAGSDYLHINLPQLQAMQRMAEATEASLLKGRIAAGRAALAMRGFNTSYQNQLPRLGNGGRDGAALHKKAVDRRRKRKNGGHK